MLGVFKFHLEPLGVGVKALREGLGMTKPRRKLEREAVSKIKP
jgi:hypothetical protein